MKRGSRLPAASAVLLLAACAAPDPAVTTDAPAAVETDAAAAPDRQTDAEIEAKMKTEIKRAGRLFQQLQFDEALEAAAKAIAYSPGRVEPYELLSSWYGQLGRHDLAIDAFERFSAQDANGLRFMARHQAFSARPEDALDTLGRCVEQHPRHAGCRFERGSLLASQGNFDTAVEDLRVAHEVDADSVTSALLAKALRVTGAYADARAVVEAALENDPDSTDLLLTQAGLLVRDRDDEAAALVLRRVIALDPTSHAALRNLGSLLLRYGEEVEGRHYLARADLYRDYTETKGLLLERIAETPHGSTLLLIAELDLTVGDFGGAQRWLDLARARDAPAQRLAAAQAWVWYALGEMAQGDAELARAGGPSDARASLVRAARAVRTGDRETAKSWLRRALAEGPDERSFLRRAADLYVALEDQEAADRLLARSATAGFP